MAKKLLERLTSDRWRNLALASLPVAYATGFFVWSSYAAKAKLGFLPLANATYLAAGYLLGTLALGTTVFPIYVSNKILKKDSPLVHQAVAELVFMVMGGAFFAVMFYIMFTTGFSVIDDASLPWWKMAILPLMLIVATLVAKVLVTLISGISILQLRWFFGFPANFTGWKKTLAKRPAGKTGSSMPREWRESACQSAY